MKRLVTALVLLCALIGISIYSYFALSSGLDELSTLAQELKETSDQQQLVDKSSQLFDLWNEKEKTFVFFIRHDTLDHITQQLAELPSLAQFEEYGSFYGKVDTILALLEDLMNSAKPTYRNLM